MKSIKEGASISKFDGPDVSRLCNLLIFAHVLSIALASLVSVDLVDIYHIPKTNT